MSLLSNVLGQYDAPQKAKDMGVYPYFFSLKLILFIELLFLDKSGATRHF